VRGAHPPWIIEAPDDVPVHITEYASDPIGLVDVMHWAFCAVVAPPQVCVVVERSKA
jgi:hypothetical protein